MSDTSRDVFICNKPKSFHPKNDDWGLPCEEHKWKIFVFDEESKVGMAICTSCAKISGGWVKDE